MKSFISGLIVVGVIAAMFTVIANLFWAFQDRHPVIVGYAALGIIIAGVALLLKGNRR